MPFESIDALAAAFSVARAQLTNVDEASLDHPTPCQSWDVRALVNHMVTAPRVAANLVAGAGTIDTDDVDFAGGDFVAAYDETATATLAAFGGPGALERVVQLPFGDRPAAFLMFFVASDQFVHAWDLSRAVGDSTDLAPQLAGELLDEAKVIVTPEMRGGDGDAAYGVERKPPSGASPADRLAAYLGRNV
ncbi:MAG: TIGR03086 family protein [Acidimicrobiaceae bacterium]|nr:TIGR03086 family protein [Acidimicrobiaceae bacterium]